MHDIETIHYKTARLQCCIIGRYYKKPYRIELEWKKYLYTIYTYVHVLGTYL